MPLELILNLEDKATPVMTGFRQEAEKAFALLSRTASQATGQLSSALSSAQRQALGFRSALASLNQESSALAQSLEESAQATATAEMEFRKEAEAIDLVADKTETLMETRGRSLARPAEFKAFWSNIELIRFALTEEELARAIKKVQSNVAGLVSLARTLGPLRFSLNEGELMRSLAESIEFQRQVISLPTTGTVADIAAVFSLPRRGPRAAPAFLQHGGFVETPYGIAERGEFVVRPEPARRHAGLLTALNQGGQPQANFNLFIKVEGAAQGINWREVARRQIIPELTRWLRRQ